MSNTIHSYKIFFLVMRTFKIYCQQLSNMQYSIINCSHQAVYYIPMTYLFHNWNCVPFDPLHPFDPHHTPHLWQPPICSLFLWVWLFKEKDSAFRWDHTAFAFLCLTNFTLHSALKFHPCCHKWQDFHIYHIFFIHSSIDGHLGCSHILAILN